MSPSMPASSASSSCARGGDRFRSIGDFRLSAGGFEGSDGDGFFEMRPSFEEASSKAAGPPLSGVGSRLFPDATASIFFSMSMSLSSMFRTTLRMRPCVTSPPLFERIALLLCIASSSLETFSKRSCSSLVPTFFCCRSVICLSSVTFASSMETDICRFPLKMEVCTSLRRSPPFLISCFIASTSPLSFASSGLCTVAPSSLCSCSPNVSVSFVSSCVEVSRASRRSSWSFGSNLSKACTRIETRSN
mmetsp:Transcript_102326/g.264604  ORF Transcript_102326/g.264604 Transcript_102326/m.264604 type:complete len:247 (+) Transcript_102326:370-1110(+)